MYRTFIEMCINDPLDEIQNYHAMNPLIDISYAENYAFRTSCWYGRLDVAKWLFELNPEMDIHADDGHAFTFACRSNHLNVAEWFVSQDPNRYSYEVADGQIISSRVRKYLPIHDDEPKYLKEGDDPNCPICYEARVELQTNCGHNYCLDCISTHFDDAPTSLCPYCRTMVTEFYPIKPVVYH